MNQIFNIGIVVVVVVEKNTYLIQYFFKIIQHFNSDPPKLEYGNRRTIVPRAGVWRAEEMPFLMPQTGMQYTILNTNARTQRNELEDLARMVSTIYLL